MSSSYLRLGAPLRDPSWFCAPATGQQKSGLSRLEVPESERQKQRVYGAGIAAHSGARRVAGVSTILFTPAISRFAGAWPSSRTVIWFTPFFCHGLGK